MAEFAFGIYYFQEKQNGLTDHLSLSMEEKVIKIEEERMHVIEQYFCKNPKEGLEMIELVATFGSNTELEELLHIIKNDLVSGDGTRTLTRLRHQAKKYNINVTTCSGEAGRY